MARKATPTSLSTYERKLLKLITTSKFFRVSNGYRGTGTQLIKARTARELRQRRLAREAIARTQRGNFPILQITGHGQDMLDGVIQEELL